MMPARQPAGDTAPAISGSQPAANREWEPSLWERLLGGPRRDALGNPIPETTSERLARLAPPATLAAVLASLIVHLVVLLIAAVIVLKTAQAGGAGDGGGPVELAIMTESELAELEQAAISGDAPAAPEIPLDEGSNIELMDPGVGNVDLGLAESIDIGAGVGAGDIGGSSGLGTGGSGGGGAATFFGAEARGTRFAYIVDVSGSMGYDNKLDALKRELIDSIGGLLENAHFFVCAFASGAAPLEGRREWIEGSDAGKLRARRAIAALIADGSTMPYPAFEVVFSLRPRPDAIYFMTDGQFEPSVAVELARLNVEDRIPIHCICFVSKEAEPLMKKIAEDSGGTYTYVAGPGARR